MITDLEMVDLMKYDKRKTVFLVIFDVGFDSEELPVEEHSELLRQKVEVYVNYIINGGAIEHFSIKDKKAMKINYEIQVFTPEYPPQEYLNCLSWINSQISGADPEHEIKLICVAP